MPLLSARLSLLSFLLLIWGSLLAQQDAYQRIEAKLISFELDSAIFEAASLQDSAFMRFYEANALAYKYFASLDIQYVKAFRADWKEYERAISERPVSDTLRNILRAELHAKRSTLEFMDGKYLSAVRFAQSCRNLLKRNRRKFGDTVDQYKLEGLFNVVLGAVPRKYLWLSNMLGYKGNVEAGIQQLETAAEKSKIMAFEADIVAFYVEKGILSRQTEAVARIERMRGEKGRNMLLDYSLSAAYLNLKKADRTLEILSRRNTYAKDKAVFFIPYWDYLQGRAHYYGADYQRAQIYFSRFLKRNKGSLFRTDATFRLGMALTLSGSYNLAQGFFRQLSTGNHSGFDEDEYAEYMAGKYAAQKPGFTELELFRARNYFDGGYFEEAIGVLTKLEKRTDLSIAEQTELHYRYGRVLHEQGKYDAAIDRYTRCTTFAETDQLWLQAYAEFYQAEIARMRSANELAMTHYKNAMAYDKYFYQAGLENRCKAAIAALRRQ